jgi:hypothetical protein
MIKSGDECDSAPLMLVLPKSLIFAVQSILKNTIDRFIGYKKHWKNDLLLVAVWYIPVNMLLLKRGVFFTGTNLSTPM